jgi:hypothetical protein
LKLSKIIFHVIVLVIDVIGVRRVNCPGVAEGLPCVPEEAREAVVVVVIGIAGHHWNSHLTDKAAVLLC